MVPDADAAASLVDTMLDTVSDNETLASISAHVAEMALRDAAEHIADEVENIIKQNRQ